MLSKRCPMVGLACMLVLVASPAAAQGGQGAVFGVGYTVNAPKLMLGGSAWALFPGFKGLGIYADYKRSTMDPSTSGEDYLSGTTAEEMEGMYPAHILHDETDWYQSFNGAVMKAVSRGLTLYAGGGWVERVHYVRYYDETEAFGRLGFYWVEDPPSSSSGPNFLGGVMIALGRNIRAQFGGETRPAGFTVGASVNVPAY
jgi:hypothetical protein